MMLAAALRPRTSSGASRARGHTTTRSGSPPGDRELRTHGSQGEQRVAVLALLLAEAELLADRRGVPPLLLLDDVLSELDGDRRAALVSRIRRGSQVLVTAAATGALPGQPDQLLEVDARAGASRVMERLGDSLDQQLRRFGATGSMPAIVAAWPAAVGEEVARNAWPARISRDRVLHVNTSSSAWAFELTQLAAVVLEQLAAGLEDSPPKALAICSRALAGATGCRYRGGAGVRAP